MKKNQYGRTLIETLGVIAIIGIFSVGALELYAKAMNTIRVNHIMEKVYIMANQIRNEKIEKKARKAFDLPSAEKIGLSYGYSFDMASSGYTGGEIRVAVKGTFSSKMCRMLGKRIDENTEQGLKEITDIDDCDGSEKIIIFKIDPEFKS